MKDTSIRPPVSSEPSEPNSAVTAGHARAPVPRYIFVTMRLEEINVNISNLAQERERLTSYLQAPSSIDGPSHKQLRLRRAYVAERIDILRKEQADLNLEKRAMGPSGSAGVGAEKKIRGSDNKKATFN